MKVLKDFFKKYVVPYSLPVLLLLSVFTNIVFVARIYFPRELESVLSVFVTPPVVSPSDHIRGNPKASISIIVYTDFQCPYCARLHDMLRTLITDTNIRWVYRHFPLGSHAQAQSAAEASECAGAQGKFWEFADALYSPGYRINSDADLTLVAAQLRLDLTAFSACMQSGQFREKVIAQRDEGFDKRVKGTPTFFINEKRYSGIMPIEQLKELLVQP